MYIVYSVTGKEASHTYYGYGKQEDYQQNFISNAGNANRERGDSRLLEELGGDVSKLEFEEIETTNTEFEAWQLRNELRVVNRDSITPPSFLPISHTKDMENIDNNKLESWKNHTRLMGKPTARQAWANGLWNNNDMKQLCITFCKKDVLFDLDNLSPFDFNTKYFLRRD